MADVKLIGSDTLAWNDSSAHLVDYYAKFHAELSGILKSLRAVGKYNGLCKFAIYSDNSGSPGDVLYQTGQVSISFGVWTDIPTADVNITKNEYYWIAFICDTGMQIKRLADGLGTVKAHSSTKVFSTWSFSNGPSTNASQSVTYALAGWGSTGCPRQAMYFKMMG